MRRLDDLLREAAKRRQDAVAVVDAERDRSVTYGELDALSDRLRDVLVKAGVQPGDRVGICVPKSIASVAAIFGSLKAGAAYVPVDPTAPATRNAYIFDDCTVRALFVESTLVDDLVATSAVTAAVQDLPDGLQAHGVQVQLAVPQREAQQSDVDALAYILYTSGSTGNPKGVMHTHASALSFVDWCSDTFDPREDDRFSSHAPFHFDLSILDLYVPIKHSAAIILIGEELGKQPLRLAQAIADHRISMWYSTPSILRLLVEYGRMEEHDYSALRIVNFAGEVFPVKHLRALIERWPHPRYFNLYGPTETNVCTYYEVPTDFPQERTEPFPIGKTCENDRCRVVDEGQTVERGGEGELYVTGGSVMVAYWNLPERSAAAFDLDENGDAWYKTGDIVREEEDGNYIFIGRRDRMVKRRGYRVELGEIESAFYRHPSVREAAVVAIPDEESGVLIKAFLAWADDSQPSLIKLKRFAADNLPLYMVPDQFSFQPALPKTSTDKIDYQSLTRLA